MLESVLRERAGVREYGLCLAELVRFLLVGVVLSDSRPVVEHFSLELLLSGVKVALVVVVLVREVVPDAVVGVLRGDLKAAWTLEDESLRSGGLKEGVLCGAGPLAGVLTAPGSAIRGSGTPVDAEDANTRAAAAAGLGSWPLIMRTYDVTGTHSVISAKRTPVTWRPAWRDTKS